MLPAASITPVESLQPFMLLWKFPHLCMELHVLRGLSHNWEIVSPPYMQNLNVGTVICSRRKVGRGVGGGKPTEKHS